MNEIEKEAFDAKVTEIYKEALEHYRLWAEKFNDVEVREAERKQFFSIMDKLEEFEQQNNLPWDYYKHNAPDELKQFHKEYYDKIVKLEEEEELSKVTEPKPEGKEEVLSEFELKGDILITDPCYVREWMCASHVRDTIYGDWGCHVWQVNHKTGEPIGEPIGQFCADSGQVSVSVISGRRNFVDEDKVRQFVKEYPHCATIIDGFSGVVKYVLRTDYYPMRGKWNESQSLIIDGEGRKGRKKFWFTTRQTSL